MHLQHPSHCFDSPVKLRLPLPLPTIKRLLRRAHSHLVLPPRQAIIRVLRKLIERHADLGAVLDVRLVLLVVDFRYGGSDVLARSCMGIGAVALTLYGGRVELDYFHCGLLQLLLQAEDELVQRGFAGAVVGTS